MGVKQPCCNLVCELISKEENKLRKKGKGKRERKKNKKVFKRERERERRIGSECLVKEFWYKVVSQLGQRICDLKINNFAT